MNTRTGESRDYFAYAGASWALLLAVLIVIPLSILFYSWTHIDYQIWTHLLQFGLSEALLNSIIVATGTALTSLCLGVYFAWMTTRYQYRGRRLLTVLLILPLAMPSYVLAFVVIGLCDYSGWLGGIWHSWTGSMHGLPVKNVPGNILILSLSLYPYVFVAAREGMQKAQRNLLDAARSLGMAPRALFFRVSLPIALPWICSGTLLVMMEALADFGVAGMLNVTTLPTAIYKTWFGFFSLSSAAQIASILLVPAIFLLFAKSKSDQLQQQRTANGGDGTFSLARPSPKTLLVFASTASLVLCFAFVGPVLRLLLWIIADVRTGIDSMLYALIPVLANTVTIAASVSLLAVCSSWAMFLALRWAKFRGLNSLITLSTVAYALPGSLLAVAFYLPAATLENLVSWNLGLTSSIGLTILALLLRFQAVSHNTLGPSFRAVPVRLEDASRSLGATSSRLIWSLFRPNLQSVSGLAALLVFIDTVKELPLTMMMRPFGWDTLAIKVFEYSADGDWYSAAVPAVILIILSCGSAVLLSVRILRGEKATC